VVTTCPIDPTLLHNYLIISSFTDIEKRNKIRPSIEVYSKRHQKFTIIIRQTVNMGNSQLYLGINPIQ
jgi:hypothetical protein